MKERKGIRKQGIGKGGMCKGRNVEGIVMIGKVRWRGGEGRGERGMSKKRGKGET